MSRLWRPFSPPGVRPATMIEAGDGAYVIDAGGRRYLDAAGGLWNVSLGLGNAALVNDVRKQLETLAFASLFHGSHRAAEALSDKLVALSGGRMGQVYLSTTGSSAVEVAVQAARLYHRARQQNAKRCILSFDLAYHGGSAVARSASGVLQVELGEPVEMLPEFVHLPSPLDETASLAALRAYLARDGASAAALLMEPVLGSGGIIVPSKHYCEAVSRLCAEHDVLLIADEVATGVGRCGAMFASDLVGLTPDIITLSKGLNSGYGPLGATLFSEVLTHTIARAGLVLHYGSTQDGNPLGCVAALATLRTIEQQQLLARAQVLGNEISTRLRELVGASVVHEVRGMGLMIGIELAHQNGAPFSAEEAGQVRALCKDAGLLVYHFQSGISLFPPLTMSDDEAFELTDILTEVLSTLI